MSTEVVLHEYTSYIYSLHRQLQMFSFDVLCVSVYANQLKDGYLCEGLTGRIWFRALLTLRFRRKTFKEYPK